VWVNHGNNTLFYKGLQQPDTTLKHFRPMYKHTV